MLFLVNNRTNTGHLSSRSLLEKSCEAKNALGIGVESSDYESISHSTPNKSLNSSSHELDSSPPEPNRVSTTDKSNSQSGEACGSAKENSVLNKSVVYLSSEITSSTSGVFNDCTTPPHVAEPPLYARAPLTNSPRIILSHKRSLVPSLTTPMKDRGAWPEEEWSPRRKG